MEAATARYATRDRFAYPTEPAATPLQRYIQNACSPDNFEPNLALSLEIADLINAKQGAAPREAAIAIVRNVNHRNPNVSLLALSLLDICVKNCGYPFHLQISTKEFLNELVRRFPERPPVRNSRTMTRILELIEEWRRTICETSKYKADLGFIRDMHRLLGYKGYVFPEMRREDAAVLNPSDSLQSAEEMEAEERSAQRAKLQELIRRGTPSDLQEANKLMKIMAGYDTRSRPDYRAKAAEEVGRVQQKAKLLEEMLSGLYSTPPDAALSQLKEGDVYEELANALASAQPKIQKMCEEESEDTEAVAKLFEINDSIHRTVERYRLVKKGDLEGARAIPRGTLGVSGAGVGRGKGNELSLIDFGGPEEEVGGASGGGVVAATQPGAVAKGNALEDDLLGLHMGDGNFGMGGGISLGAGSSGPSNGSTATTTTSTADILAQFSQPAASTLPSSNASASSNALLFSSPAPQTQAQIPAQSQPSFDFFAPAATSSSTITSKATTAPSTLLNSSSFRPSTPNKSDPFAALSSAAASTPPRQASPAPATLSTRSPPPAQRAGMGDLLGMGNGNVGTPASRPGTAGTVGSVAAEDEWTFSSALPDDAPVELQITPDSPYIRTVFTVKRIGETDLEIQSRISNVTSQAIGDLTFQLAVTKAYTLHLQPQSSRSLSAHQSDGVTQRIRLEGVDRGMGSKVKLRWRASYSVDGTARNEQGEISGLGVP